MMTCFVQGVSSREQELLHLYAAISYMNKTRDKDVFKFMPTPVRKSLLSLLRTRPVTFQAMQITLEPHSMRKELVQMQLEISRRNLGLQTIDVYYIHNPEIELGAVPRQTVLSRMKRLFAALEQAVADGKISMYGVSSWNAFRVTSGAKNYLSLEELVNFARSIAGENHRLKVVMVPFNLHLQDVANNPTQHQGQKGAIAASCSAFWDERGSIITAFPRKPCQK